MGSFATETRIEAPVADVWQALGAIGEIHLWNPGVEASHTTSAESGGLGTPCFESAASTRFAPQSSTIGLRPLQRVVPPNCTFALWFFFFPNLLEPLFLIYVTISRFKGWDKVHEIYRHRLRVIWIFILLYKFQDEYFTHVANVDRSDFIRGLFGG